MKKSKMVFVQMLVVSMTINFSLAMNKGLLDQIFEYLNKGESVNFGSFYLLTMINFMVAAILIVCGLGILGVLLSMIARRKKEISLNIAVGATYKDIFQMVVFSWTCKAAIPSTIIGWGLSTFVICVLANRTVPGLDIRLGFSPVLCACSLFGVGAYCVIVSLYPAITAMRTNVIQALSAS